MAKTAKFSFKDSSFECSLTKVDRDKVYGYVEEKVTDKLDKSCILGAMLDDGQTVILPGSTVLKTVDEQNSEVDKKALKTVYMDGSDAVLMPSVYDQEVKMEAVDIIDLFNLEVSAVYQLNGIDGEAQKIMFALTAGDKLYRFAFNYRSDYDAADAILLGNGKDVFVMAGRSIDFEYLQNTTVVIPVDEDTTSEEDDNLDFGML